MSIYFSLIPHVLQTASPPEKRHLHRPTDRMTEIEILEDIYVAQVAGLFAGVVKNSVLPRWRSAAIKWLKVLRIFGEPNTSIYLLIKTPLFHTKHLFNTDISRILSNQGLCQRLVRPSFRRAFLKMNWEKYL